MKTDRTKVGRERAHPRDATVAARGKGIVQDPWHFCFVLGDPTRAAILRLLGARPHSAAELCRALRLGSSTLHYHLSVLKSVGVVEKVQLGSLRLVALQLGPMRQISRALLAELRPPR